MYQVSTYKVMYTMFCYCNSSALQLLLYGNGKEWKDEDGDDDGKIRKMRGQKMSV